MRVARNATDVAVRGTVGLRHELVEGLEIRCGEDFPEAIGAVYPQNMVRTRIVHLIRKSLAFVSWKDRKSVVQDLKHV